MKKVLFLFVLVFSALHMDAQWLKSLQSSDELYREAKRELDLKHYQNAINLCLKGVDISPRNLDIHLLLGRSYAAAGKIDSARMELNHVISKDPKYRDAYIYLVNMEASICNYSQAIEYADMGLKYFPNDKDLILKKMDIYEKQGNWTESNRIAELLFELYPNDNYVKSVYVDYKLSLAREYSHRGFVDMAKKAYEAVLEQDPLNKEALQAINNLDVRSGNYESSNSYINRALQSSPNSYEFLMKKIGVLEAMGRYSDAIEVIQKLVRLYPNKPEVQKLNIYMRMEAGRYYMNMDPYLLFESVLDKEPSNREALNYVINIAAGRGLMNDALHWTNAALKHYPNDQEFIKKKIGILEEMKEYIPASQLAEEEWKNNPSEENKSTFLELRALGGKQFILDQSYDSAIYALKSVLYYDHTNMLAINYLISAYEQQKNYDEAIRTINEALTYYPDDEGLLFKKAGLLESYGHNAEAAEVSRQLLQKHPESRQYLLSFVDQSLAAGRQSLQYNDYENTVSILKEVLDKQPDNVDALNYIINIESAFKQYDSALAYTDLALHYYPDSKDFLFKKSSVYADAKQFHEAYEISGELYHEFPYNNRYRDAYVDQLLGSGRQYVFKENTDSALIEFNKALAASPNDTNALTYTINLLVDKKRYKEALVYIRKGRSAYPNAPYYLLMEARVYENMKQYNNAWLASDTLAKLNPSDLSDANYQKYLYNLTLKNEIGVGFLHSTYDYQSLVSNVATIFYTHKFEKWTFTPRIDYAGRPWGTGFEAGLEAYYHNAPKWYSYFLATYAGPKNVVFPDLRLGYSLFHGLNKGWEAELGIRYIKSDTVSITGEPAGKIVAGVASLSKEANDFYFNLRGYLINFNSSDYWSALLTSRYYLNNHSDYFSVLMGYGTAPDDFTLNYEITKLLAYKTVIVGAGYSKQINYRTTFGIFATWDNEQVRETQFHNEYDLYFLLLRRF